MTLEHDHSEAAEQLELNPGIGAELRYLREQAGMSIEDVATGTRIQADYIAALEDGRHEALPGAAYAIGFLRTYSDYLGMNADEAVERFKDEEAVRTNPTPLVFPAPIGETRRPGWRLALLSLLLAGAVYGTWISMQKIGGVDLERILPPPERLTDFLKSNDPNNPMPQTEGKMEPTGDSPRMADTQLSKQPDEPKTAKPEPTVSAVTTPPKPLADPATTVSSSDTQNETVEISPVAPEDKPANSTVESNNTKPVGAESTVSSVAPTIQESTPAAALTQTETTPIQVVPADQKDESGTESSVEAQSPVAMANVEKLAVVDTTTASAEKLAAVEATPVVSREETPTDRSSDTTSDGVATTTPANSTQDATLSTPTPAQAESTAPETSSSTSADESTATQQTASQTESGSENQTSTGQGDPQDSSIAAPREESESSPPAAPPSPPQIAAIRSDPAPISPESRMAEPIPSGQTVALQPEPQSQQGQPRVYGASNADARVVVRAHSDSWVQIQGPNKETLLTRILHAGDTYLAPSRDDLMLVTGNAGAVEIIVDGESLGMVGEFGQVRRDLSLDPVRVRSELANR